MCEEFTKSTDMRIVASAGYRLSWYLETVPNEFVKTLDAGLHRMTDADLARTLAAAAFLFDNDGEHFAELIAWLLARLPDAPDRIRRLIETDELPPKDRECTVQILELWAQEELPELRAHVPRPS